MLPENFWCRFICALTTDPVLAWGVMAMILSIFGIVGGLAGIVVATYNLRHINRLLCELERPGTYETESPMPMHVDRG